MPRVSIWLIRTAMVHFVSGAMLGTAYLLFKAFGAPVFAVSHRPVHIEQMLIGWMVQLVIGVAYWILPRPADLARPPQVDRRASGATMWLVYGLLNAGILVAAFGEDPRIGGSLALPGRIAETAAVALFALHAWNRQRPYRAAARRLIV